MSVNHFHGSVKNAVLGNIKSGGNVVIGDNHPRPRKHKNTGPRPDHMNVVRGNVEADGDYYLGDPAQPGKFVKQAKSNKSNK